MAWWLGDSLDNRLGGFDMPIMRTPGSKKALKTENEKLFRSTREKTSPTDSVTTTI